MLTLSQGLGKSVNTVTAYLLREVGIQPVIDLAHNMGVESEIPFQPSICLGTPEVTVFEMTAAYSAFANKGIAVRPVFVTRIEDKNGNIIAEFPAKRVEVMREEISAVMVDMMQYVMDYGTVNVYVALNMEELPVRLQVKPELLRKTPMAGLWVWCLN